MSVSAIALSGLNAASAALGVSAHNVANAMTPGFRRQTAEQQSRAEGGVLVTIGAAAEPGAALETDLVQQRVALHAFEANLATIRAADEMLGTLLDTRA